MTGELQSTLEAFESEYPALRNHLPCMGHFILLDVGAFMCSLGEKGRTKSSDAHDRDQKFGENQSIEIGKSERLSKKGNARNYKVSAMRPGFAKMIEKVRISRNFHCLETDVHLEQHACCIYNTDTGSSKRVHWLLKRQSMTCSTNYYECKNMAEFDTAVAWVSR